MASFLVMNGVIMVLPDYQSKHHLVSEQFANWNITISISKSTIDRPFATAIVYLRVCKPIVWGIIVDS